MQPTLVNGENSDSKETAGRNVGLFCETRRTEKHSTLANVDEMYASVVACLDATASVEGNWEQGEYSAHKRPFRVIMV